MTNPIKLRLLSTNDVAMLHDKCMHLLINKGVSVEYPKALELLDKAFKNLEKQSDRISVSVKFDYREGKKGRLKGKTKSVENELGRSLITAR